MTKTKFLAFCLMGALLPAVCGRAQPDAALSPDYLAEILRHLYRWHLDETALLRVDDRPDIEFWIRDTTPVLDAEDQSQYRELLLPDLSLKLILKRADYPVSETGLRIQNADFRIMRTETMTTPPAATNAYTILRLPKQATIERLFATRNNSQYPDAAMLERMRQALRAQIGRLPESTATEVQTFYIAPLSPVANDLWVFWESGGTLIRFASDTDLASPAYWEYEKLGVRLYNLKTDVVVSLAEAAGSNAYVTRDWAARALFNCVVFGRRLLIVPEADLNKPMSVIDVPTPAPPPAAAP